MCYDPLRFILCFSDLSHPAPHFSQSLRGHLPPGDAFFLDRPGVGGRRRGGRRVRFPLSLSLSHSLLVVSRASLMSPMSPMSPMSSVRPAGGNGGGDGRADGGGDGGRCPRELRGHFQKLRKHPREPRSALGKGIGRAFGVCKIHVRSWQARAGGWASGFRV